MITAVVVDDDKDTVDVFCDFLDMKQVKVLGRGYNGKDALELYQLYRPDIMFVDLMMPEYDGFYALEKIRKIDPSARIVVITADLRADSAKKLEVLKPTEIFIKPYDLEKITEMLEKI
jgi:DNA-binding NtrC family response regulator